jgi:hypothetical protein
MRVTIKDQQSLFDIALQEYGSAASAFDIALANGLSVTAFLAPGESLDVPNDAPTNSAVLVYYKNNQVTPATDKPSEYVAISAGGYVSEGYWVNGYVKTN